MSVHRQLFSLWLVFFVNGAVLASWSPRIPEVAAALDINDAALGMALLGFAAGAIPAMASAARVIRWVPPERICLISVTVFSLGLPLIAVAPSIVVLFLVLVGMGVAGGLCDITMNLAAVGLQHRVQRRVLGRLHAGFSLGVVAGGLGALAATTLDTTVAVHFTVVAALLITLTVGAALGLAGAGDPKAVEERASGFAVTPGRRSSDANLPVAIIVLAISGLLLEGAITDWSALLLTRDLGATSFQGAMALTLFSAAMVASRAVTDWLVHHLGERALLLIGALFVAGAMTVGILSLVSGIVVGSIVVAGLAIGPVFPIALSRASRYGGPAASIARISVIGYTAGLIGPLLIGLISNAAGLPATVIGAVVVGSLGILLALRSSSGGRTVAKGA